MPEFIYEITTKSGTVINNGTLTAPDLQTAERALRNVASAEANISIRESTNTSTLKDIQGLDSLTTVEQAELLKQIDDQWKH
ncbi:hypothetical protein CSV86_021470 [Pseudomonas putida CSV86]|uniref:Uncharacterized protein n=1 Tax=Pseudomonas bharatica CSV86 TaxID=1005395 RepID=L1LTZ0_9PSED|nr:MULTISPECIES: hypothetical protein [Pseudomonas]MDG9882888.1 hypothetical protein [Pseudomonas sp. GD04058]NNJ17571.1 hypothetical protein [Pseudomonas bharatica CSV86]